MEAIKSYPPGPFPSEIWTIIIFSMDNISPYNLIAIKSTCKWFQKFMVQQMETKRSSLQNRLVISNIENCIFRQLFQWAISNITLLEKEWAECHRLWQQYPKRSRERTKQRQQIENIHLIVGRILRILQKPFIVEQPNVLPVIGPEKKPSRVKGKDTDVFFSKLAMNTTNFCIQLNILKIWTKKNKIGNMAALFKYNEPVALIGNIDAFLFEWFSPIAKKITS